MVERRAPFSDNPKVGARGQRTGQRILDAARVVLGRSGYHRCGVEMITSEVGCSRATFYQYFADKETVFAELAAQVADQLDQAARSVEAVTGDAQGWKALRSWVDRYADVYDSNEAVFHNFATAAAADAEVARRLSRGARLHREMIRNRISGSELEPQILGDVVDVAASTLARLLDDVSTLRRGGREVRRADLLDAYVDVVHRTLYGLDNDVNVHTHSIPKASARRAFDSPEHDRPDTSTRRSLLRAGREVLVENGYHGSSIDSIAERAGVAHGTFYRYFVNKEELIRELVAEASDKLSSYLRDAVTILSADVTDATDLRSWLRVYTRAQLDEMAILRVWSEAALVDDQLRIDAAPMLEWGRRQMAASLSSRGFPGEQADAVILVALIDSLASAARPASTLEAAALTIERGFLGN